MKTISESLHPVPARQHPADSPGALEEPLAPISISELFLSMPVTRQHWIAGLILFVAFVVESWEMLIIILAGASVSAEFGLDATGLGTLISAIFWGMIPGAFIWGKVSNAYGRKASILFSLISYGLLTLASSMAPDYLSLLILRLLCGVAISGLLVTTFPYFEELLPVAVRGKATVYLASGWPIGFLIAIASSHYLADYGWRWIIGVSAVGGCWAWVVFRYLPESPLWLHHHGRSNEARQVMLKLAGGANARQILHTPLTIDPVGTSTIMTLFRSQALKISVLQIIINFCFSWGYWALSSWMPVLLAKRGFSAPDGLGFMALSALFMFPGYMAASWLTARIGRKKVMACFVLLAGLAGFGFAFTESLSELYFWYFVLSFFSLGAWGVWDTWMGELYNTEMRVSAYAVGLAAQKVANAIAPICIGAMLASQSVMLTVAFISCFLLLTFAASLFLPETEGQALH